MFKKIISHIVLAEKLYTRANNSALTLRLFWLQSQRLNLAENPEVFFLLFQILWTIAVDGTQCFVLNTDRSLQAKHDFVGKTRSILAAFKRKLFWIGENGFVYKR